MPGVKRRGRRTSRDCCPRLMRACGRAGREPGREPQDPAGRRDPAADRGLARMERYERARLSAAYHRFAEDEAHGKSPLYEELARGVAGDHEILDFLLTLPRLRRQPTLLPRDFSSAPRMAGAVSDAVSRSAKTRFTRCC